MEFLYLGQIIASVLIRGEVSFQGGEGNINTRQVLSSFGGGGGGGGGLE